MSRNVDYPRQTFSNLLWLTKLVLNSGNVRDGLTDLTNLLELEINLFGSGHFEIFQTLQALTKPEKLELRRDVFSFDRIFFPSTALSCLVKLERLWLSQIPFDGNFFKTLAALGTLIWLAVGLMNMDKVSCDLRLMTQLVTLHLEDDCCSSRCLGYC